MQPSLCRTDELTLASVHRDFVEWRQGRSYYAVWTLDLAGPELSARSERLRTHFAKQLLPAYCRQPHLTLQLCGFPVAQTKLADDYGLAAFCAQVAALKTAQTTPFVIEIGQPASFTSAAYFSVRDPEQGIARLRQTLMPTVPIDDFPYVPHVSFGLYRHALPLQDLVREMQAVDGGDILHLEIKRLSWMTYRAAQIGGPLSSVAEFDLQHGHLNIRDKRFMEAVFGEPWQTTIFF